METNIQKKNTDRQFRQIEQKQAQPIDREKEIYKGREQVR